MGNRWALIFGIALACSFRWKLPVTTTVTPSNSYCRVWNYDPSTPTTRPCRRVQRHPRREGNLMKKLAMLAGGAALVAGLAACSSSGTSAPATHSATASAASKSGTENLVGQVTGAAALAK
jgi:hypothetical protein